MMEAVTEYELRRWRTPADDPYAAYWNDEAAEREKEWWVDEGGDFATMERHVESSGLARQLADALATAQRLRRRPLAGEGADLAAGTLWAVPLLLSAGAIRVYAVEYSEHRLLKLGPKVLKHYGVEPPQVVLCHGSFYELDLPEGSLDVVLMSQALHHADDPSSLLREVRRVLRPDGVVLVIGEHLLESGFRSHVAAALGRLGLRSGSTRPALPTNPATGDHYYRADDYARMFAEAGFRASTIRFPELHAQSFILRRRHS